MAAAAVSGLFDPAVREDPHGGYHRARAMAPVVHDPHRGEWFALSWAACEAALKGHGWSADRTTWQPEVDDEASRQRLATGERLRRFIAFVDAPDHQRLRSLVSKAFTPRVVRDLQPWIEGRVAELVDQAQDEASDGSVVDLVELTSRLPVEAICRLLGVPVEDVDQVNRWSRDAVRVFDLAELAPAEAQAVITSTRRLNAYLRDVIADRRAAPGSDLLSGLIAAEEAGHRLSDLELQSLAAFLFVAGHETTASLAAGTLHGLLTHPEQWARLVDDPGLAAGAVEEGMRWDGPVHCTERIASGDQVLDGVAVPAGALVNVVIAAANRDPGRFADPDAFDIGRQGPSNLAFGFGPHHCIGAALGRAEAATTVRVLASRWPQLRLACDPSEVAHRPHLIFRGLRALPAEVGPARR